MTDPWYIDADGHIEGPVDLPELQRHALLGRLRPTDRVSTDLRAWVEALGVPGLRFPRAHDTRQVLRTLALDLTRTAVVAPEDWIPGYDVLSVLGTGSCGTVVQARQRKLDRLVAVKIIHHDGLKDPARAARFEQEAIALAKFHHPNIVQVYDYGRTRGEMFIAMELLEGEDLGHRLRRAGPLDERSAWALARQAAAALAHAAERGVVHRDVKPANLFLVPAPSGIGLPRDVPMVKVTDFGLALARRGGDPAAHERLTADGMLLGTPVYMAPEQYRTTEVDHRADVYALGATVFHALTGRPPFDGATVWDVIGQKRSGSPALDTSVSRASADLVAAMMAPDPDARIASYEDLIDRIDRLPGAARLAAPTQSPPPVGPASRAGPAPPRRWRWVAAAAGFLIVAAAALTGALSRKTAADLPAPAPPRAAPPEYVVDGYQESWLHPEQMNGWLVSAGGGERSITKDEEGVRVLTVRGGVCRRFLPLPHYQVTLGLDLHEASAVEVHFAIPAAPSATAATAVLHVSSTGGAVLATRAGEKGELRPLGERVAFPPAAWFKDRRPYLEVRVAKAGGRWLASFNGREVGSFADDGTPRRPEVRVFAAGGHARIDSALLEPLAEKKPG